MQDLRQVCHRAKNAMRLRACPPIDVKSPPTYTVVPKTARLETLPFAFGLKAGSTLPLARMWAMLVRTLLPTRVTDVHVAGPLKMVENHPHEFTKSQYFNRWHPSPWRQRVY